ncbi:MAG: BREX-1 system adenine-specific DNA-methyltransferase PglX, partial [Thermoanaerobaculia bacterium]|nr:BREX-1 system adenine-specific DNA-methyltransferase PglX [Thermoanaerobaculia bacterium]
MNLPDEVIAEGQAIPDTLRASAPEHHEVLRPDIVIRNPLSHGDGQKPRLLIQIYPATQDLEKRVTGKTWSASPASRMVDLLHAAGVRLGLVTNGEQWMLVDAPRDDTSGFASWYATLWCEEQLTLRAFRTLLGVDRFFGVADEETLEAMLAESAQNQQDVTDQLGYQVRKAVEVLVQALDRADQDHSRSLLAGVNEAVLYEAALTVMMRLVFLFCAEERGLLLLGDPLFDQHYAVSTLREQLRLTADQHGEEILERRHDAWCRLLSTFRAVHGGVKHERMTILPYGGDLFDPDRYPFLEGRKRGTSWHAESADPLPVNNRTVLHLLEALQILKVKLPGGGSAEARKLSFQALDIEQIGHVYEGLLDHTAKRATEPTLGLVGTRDKTRDFEPEMPLSKLDELLGKGTAELVKFLKEESGRSAQTLEKLLDRPLSPEEERRYQTACGLGKDGGALWQRVKPFAVLIRDDSFGYPVIIRAGSVYVTEGTDRRSTGTQYTPRSLTEPVVRYALEPIVYIGPAEGKPRSEWRLRSPREILALRICDFACGSGAFLVQICRYLSERLVEAWDEVERQHPGPPRITPEGEVSDGLPDERLIPKDPDERLAYARRIAAQRCIYGVDINPLAVEMAKLSMWLLTLAKDKPFTFLDHSIRCGDSLVGIHDLKQLKRFSLREGPVQTDLFAGVPLDAIVEEAVTDRLKLEGMEGGTVEDVASQRELLAKAEDKLARLKAVADTLIAVEFGLDKTTAMERAAKLLAASHPVSVRSAVKGLPFHWPLEFPEVFQDSRSPGFHAFVGNPPFMGGQKITGNLGTAYRDFLVTHIASRKRGSADLCSYFFLRMSSLVRNGGMAGLLATNTIAQGDTREVGLDQLLGYGFSIPRAIPSRKWPGQANLEVAHVWMRKGPWGESVLDEKPVPKITAFLTPPGKAEGKPQRLAENADKSFQGSNVLGMGFVLEPDEAQALIEKDPRNKDVLFPYLHGEDLNTRSDHSASRWVINFHDWTLERAETYPNVMKLVRDKVKPERDKLAAGDATARERAKRWWQFARPTMKLYAMIMGMERVVAVSLVTHHVGFAFVPTGQVYAHRLAVFTLPETGHFALLQSNFHEPWARIHSSSLETRINYSPSDCFETFPFPRDLPSLEGAGDRYDAHRRSIMLARQEGLTKTYNRFHNPEETSEDIQTLRNLHVEMDQAVAKAYGWEDLDLGHGFHETKQGLRFTVSELARREILDRLLQLNHERYAEEVMKGLHEKKAKKGRKASVTDDENGRL